MKRTLTPASMNLSIAVLKPPQSKRSASCGAARHGGDEGEGGSAAPAEKGGHATGRTESRVVTDADLKL